MSEWKKVKLGEIAKGIQTGPFGSQLHQSDYSDCGIPVVMPKDIINGRIVETSIAHVEQHHVDRLSRHKISKGDILYARRGDVGKCAYVTESQEGWLCGTGCLRVTINKELAYPKFIFFQLQKRETIGWVEKHAIGATMLNLNTSILGDVPIELPSLNSQKQVVDILSRYDSLIENYQKQIKLLEEAAQRLYKEWFVDLHFPGHENTKIINGLPDGWEKKKVGELIIKTHRTKHVSANKYQKSGQIPIIDQSRNYIAGYTDDMDCIVNVTVPYIVFGDHTRILKYISFSFAKGADGTQLIMSNDLKRMPQSLLYNSLKGIDLSSYSYARHFKYLKEETLLLPTECVAKKYDVIVAKHYYDIQKCRNQIRLLTEARDRLLPKLMSGEIEVGEDGLKGQQSISPMATPWVRK